GLGEELLGNEVHAGPRLLGEVGDDGQPRGLHQPATSPPLADDGIEEVEIAARDNRPGELLARALKTTGGKVLPPSPVLQETSQLAHPAHLVLFADDYAVAADDMWDLAAVAAEDRDAGCERLDDHPAELFLPRRRGLARGAQD